MKIAIDYQEVDVSKEEADYYKEIVSKLTTKEMEGKEYFRELFQTDDRGFITIIKPKNSIPWIVLYFVQQIQISQRLRLIDDFVNKQEKK
jgi:hypothetical protein